MRLRRELRSCAVDYFQHGWLEPLPQVRDIEWFDENGDTMRMEDWQYGEGRLLCVRRALRLDDGRVELSLLLINNTGEPHNFQLPQPVFRWTLRLDTAGSSTVERELEQPIQAVGEHSVQLLSTLTKAASEEGVKHPATDSAMQPQHALRPKSAPTSA